MNNYKFDGTKRFNVRNFDCADKGEFSERHETIQEFTENLEKINEYQQKLFAEQKEGIIFIFQAMDAAGKDGAVRAVLSCLSPQGVSEHSFKVPTAEENRHDYLWRFWDSIPEKGSISILNRSYYEDVLVQKVHKIYEKNNYADRIDRETIIDKRYEQIRNFEKYLWENSIRVVKVFLNVSKDEQARRFISRIDTPKKNWKFSSGDIDEREYWDEYMDAYETCINRTAQKNTPWYVVPADHKWYARLVISRIVLNELENMDPKWPVLGEEQMNKLKAYRERLAPQTELQEDNGEDDGKKLKPSDTAVGIALKNDRQALSEKKFRKLLKKSVFENFNERFGVSVQTQEQLGKIYLDIEEAEAKAEADAFAEVDAVYQEKKDAMKAELKGFGKEAKALLKRYKQASRTQIDAFVEEINLSYVQYEEELKQIMIEYEVAVGTEGASAEEALKDYESKLRSAFEVHSTASTESKEDTIAKLIEIADEYAQIGSAFRTVEKKPAETDTVSDEAEAEPIEVAEAEPTEVAEAEPAEVAEAEPIEDAEAEPIEVAVAEPTEVAEAEPAENAEAEPAEVAEVEPAEVAE